MKATLCSCLCAFTVLGWLVSVRLAWPDPALYFVTPKQGVYYVSDPLKIQVRRSSIEPADRLLDVVYGCAGDEFGRFQVQLDDLSGYALPSPARSIRLYETCPGMEIVAALVMVRDGKAAIRALARTSVMVQ